jgi:hypothetical protein
MIFLLDKIVKQLRDLQNGIHLRVPMQTHGQYGQGRLHFFFQYCIAGDWEACENIEWVEEWQQRALSPTSTYVQHETTIEDNQVFASDDYDCVSNLVQEGTLN